jgi:HlyD family secretion protein
MKNRRKRALIIGICVVVLLLTAWFFMPTQTSHAVKTISPHAVQTRLVTRRAVIDYYKAVGTTKPTIESNLAAQITATVDHVLVSPGQKVKAGQLLVVLDNRDYLAKMARAAQGVNAAKAIFQQTKQMYGRMKALIKSGYVTKVQYDNSESHFLQAKAALSQAKKRRREAQVGLSYCQLRAPAKGRILNKFVEPGDQARPGKILLTFQANHALRLVADVPEALISHIKLGDRLPVQIDTQQKILTAKVVEIVPSVDPQTRSFLVKVILPNSAGLYPGMFGRLWIPMGHQSVLLIPKKSIYQRGQLQFVNLRSGGQTEKVLITTGKPFKPSMIEVLSGLNVGDQLVMPGKTA